MSQSRRTPASGKNPARPEPGAEKAPGQNIDLNPGAEKLLSLFFLAAAIVGLFLCLMLALSYTMTSDTVNAGLFAREVMQGNFEYIFPANNPYFFTDYIFHLIIQPLTGYSPLALTLTGYAMYVLIVLACGALAWRLAGRMEGLAAAALVANLSFLGLRYVICNLYHNGTILFILLSILVFYADRPPFRLSLRWRVTIIGLLQLLGVFSDSIMLPLFTLPLIVYAAYVFLKQRTARNADGNPLLWLASTVAALIVYVLKTRVGQLWPGGPILQAGADLGSAGSLLQHPEMLTEYVNALARDAGGVIFAAGILVIVLLVILERKDRFLQIVLVAGSIFMLIGFMSMVTQGDSARYLTLIVILALVVIATGIRRREVNYIPLFAAILLIVIYAWSNVQTLQEPHLDYSKIDQQFLDTLYSRNITHAYSDYWTANLYTYLSGGQVMIEPCTVQDGKLKFYNMNVAPRWATIWPDGNDTQPVIITAPGDSLYDWTQEVNKNHPPETTYQIGSGWIYVYNGTLPAWPA